MTCPFCDDTGINENIVWELVYVIERKPCHCEIGQILKEVTG